MSRSDLRQAEFDYSIYGDGRDFLMSVSPQYVGRGSSIHSTKGSMAVPRDMHRDLIPRDYGPPSENIQGAAYYQSPPLHIRSNMHTNTNAGLTGEGGRGGDIGGYPAWMAPSQRIYGNVPAQPVRNGTSHEEWNSVHVLSNNRQSPGGSAVSSGPAQVQHSSSVVSQHSLVLNHHHRSSPPRLPLPCSSLPDAQLPYNGDRDRETVRDAYYTTRHGSQQHSQHQSISSPHSLAPPASASPPTSAQQPRSTLWWGELEPWMDEEYARQVCNLMGWDPVNIKVPRPAPDPASGRQVANNPGYCFLTFPSQNHAASVLAQINNASNTMTMPNSSRPFTLNWASSVPGVPLNGGVLPTTTISIPGAQNPQYPKEYSIFVGDLAPEVSNSDLVAVFRNPVLGLRNDREPRFIRPFLSCKSAKIMLDPITGVSRGYGFVRFTDETDQQRALIEMHGLYCLSRPMRISPATAKFKSAPGMPGMELAQMYGASPQTAATADQVTIALPLPSTNQTKSVSAPLATPSGNTSSSGSATSLGTASNSGSFLSAQTTMSSSSTLASASAEDASGSQSASHSSPNAASAANHAAHVNSMSAVNIDQQLQDQITAQRFSLSEESWKHHAQARAILSNLIGPNGEQLTSSDPYNTTVFVGGLSPLISEETLRTFFAPFGDIHYVKVPVGKHCGFVQFVRKPDAERAIEKMQGFSIGGSRIRLSWGRSQYKAAQAAAQAAQAAAFQAQYHLPQPQSNNALTAEQAMQLLEKFGIAQFLNNTALQDDPPAMSTNPVNNGLQNGGDQGHSVPYDMLEPSFEVRQPNGPFGASTFSPFSPDPNYLAEGLRNSNLAHPHPQQYSYEPKGYAPWYAVPPQEEKISSNGSGKVSPTSVGTSRPSSSTQRFGTYLSSDNSGGSPFQLNRASSRQEAPIARPDLTKRPSQIALSSDHGSIQDLNGTLASLKLDHTQWRPSNVDAAPRALPTTP